MNERAIHPEGYWLDQDEERRWWGPEQFFTRKQHGEWVSTRVQGLVYGQYVEPGTPGRQAKKQYTGPDKIRAIKEAYTAQDILDLYGWEYQDRGRYLQIRCPNPEHADENPSCTAFPDGFKCWSCGLRGDVVDLAGYLEVKTNAE